MCLPEVGKVAGKRPLGFGMDMCTRLLFKRERATRTLNFCPFLGEGQPGQEGEFGEGSGHVCRWLSPITVRLKLSRHW